MNFVAIIVFSFVFCTSSFFFLKKRSTQRSLVALHPQEYRKFKLIKKEAVNHNSILVRLALPSQQHHIGLPIGKHMYIRGKDEAGNDFSRAYTPVSSDDQLGHVDFLIKLYPNGMMSNYLRHLNIGDFIEARGPLGKLTYHNYGQFEIHNNIFSKLAKPHMKRTNIGLIAGGSGITPMLQIIRSVAKKNEKDTNVHFLYANVTLEDILCKQELDQIIQQHTNIKVHYILDKPPANWKGGVGFVSADMIKEHLPLSSDSSSLILMCGPPLMISSCEKHLKSLDFKEHQYFMY